MNDPHGDRLRTVNQHLPIAAEQLGELLLLVAGTGVGQCPTSTELRAAGRTLVAFGGAVTELGVTFGIRADDLDRGGETR